MKALSLWQPWAWLIANGHKTMENRNWNTTFRGTFLIHASLTYDKQVDASLFEHWGVATFWPNPTPEGPNTFDRGGIVGVATLTDVVTHSASRWFRGKYGFALTDACPLPFTPVRGARTFFDVPQAIIDALAIHARTADSLAARAVAKHPDLFGTHAAPIPGEERVRALKADAV